MKDFYKILEIDYSASDMEIKKAFKKKILIYHPDKNPDNKNLFTDIMEAYNILLNPDLRFKYNLSLIRYYNGKGIKKFISRLIKKGKV